MTIELYNMPVTVISFDALAEFVLGEERHKLREDCFAFIHGLQELALMPFRKLTSSNRKIIFPCNQLNRNILNTHRGFLFGN